MKKSEVLKIIDEVMNNREIDSIRNAILAIRDKVIEAHEMGRYTKAKWETIENGKYLRCSNCYCSLPVRNDADDFLFMLDDNYNATVLESCSDYCPFCGAKIMRKSSLYVCNIEESLNNLWKSLKTEEKGDE